MKEKEYKKIVEKNTPKENVFKNALISFLTGGFLGVLFSLLSNLICSVYHLAYNDGIIWSLIIFIFMASLLTGLGVFDLMVSYAKCGLIIPITGFAHSVTSSILDYKHDGFITGMGGNIFKLAGSVILYGVVSAFILVMIKAVMIYG